MLYKVTRKPSKAFGGHFENDPQIFDLFDILADSYGVLPSDLLGLSFQEIMFNIRCLKSRSYRMNKLMKQSNRKKAMLFPTVNISDLLRSL